MSPSSANLDIVLVLAALGISTILLLFGPPSLLGRRSADRPAPWYLGKTVYAPVLAVILLTCLRAALAQIGATDAPWQTLDFFVRALAEKYDLVLLILSFAYLSVSLDQSGFFEFCALRIVRRSEGNGLKLLVLMFLLCSGLTFFTSNDVVILSMTPIILYVGKGAGIRNLVPLLISQFIAANTLSMGLYIGSPTNIVLGDAANMTFIDFARWMIVPAVVSCGVTLAMLLVVFHLLPLRGNTVQRRYEMPSRALTIQSNSLMWVKVAIFAVALGFLTASSYIKVELWKICLVAALVLFAIDLRKWRVSSVSVRDALRGINRRMPWAIAPFVVCYFTLVYSLSATGLLERISHFLIQLGQGSTVRLSLIFGYASAFLVNLMNDIPSTVFWANMVPHLRENLSPAQFDVVVYSTIVGVNPGCYLTLIGALAGLMWMTILKEWSVGGDAKLPTGRDLTVYGLLVIGPVILVTCLTVVLEVMLFR